MHSWGLCLEQSISNAPFDTQKLLAMLGDMARGDPEQAPKCPKGLIFVGSFRRSARVRSIKAHFVPKKDEKTRGQ